MLRKYRRLTQGPRDGLDGAFSSLAVANDVHVRSPAAKPGGKKSCRTVGRGYAGYCEVHFTAGRLQQNNSPWLAARWPSQVCGGSCEWSPASPKAPFGCPLSDGVLRSGIDTAGFGPGVSADP